MLRLTRFGMMMIMMMMVVDGDEMNAHGNVRFGLNTVFDGISTQTENKFNRVASKSHRSDNLSQPFRFPASKPKLPLLDANHWIPITPCS